MEEGKRLFFKCWTFREQLKFKGHTPIYKSHQRCEDHYNLSCSKISKKSRPARRKRNALLPVSFALLSLQYGNHFWTSIRKTKSLFQANIKHTNKQKQIWTNKKTNVSIRVLLIPNRCAHVHMIETNCWAEGKVMRYHIAMEVAVAISKKTMVGKIQQQNT